MRFALYAGRSLETWQALLGCGVTHLKFGPGTVIGVIQDEDGDIIISVEFSQDHGAAARRFVAIAFDGAFTHICLPPEIADEVVSGIQAVEREAERQRAQAVAADEQRKGAERSMAERRLLETDARRHFAELKSKYCATSFTYDQATSPLYKILVALEDEEAIEGADLQWLKERSLHGPLAEHYRQQFQYEGDPWDAIQASSHLRKIDRSSMALELTECLSPSDPIVMAALLTTRGGALKDLRRLEEAHALAIQAIKCNPKTFHGYNLLGAIACQSGLAEEGLRHFEKALELGASPEAQDREIRLSVERASDADRVKVARWLYDRDSKKYFWAAHYLRPHPA